MMSYLLETLRQIERQGRRESVAAVNAEDQHAHILAGGPRSSQSPNGEPRQGIGLPLVANLEPRDSAIGASAMTPLG